MIIMLYKFNKEKKTSKQFLLPEFTVKLKVPT